MQRHPVGTPYPPHRPATLVAGLWRTGTMVKCAIATQERTIVDDITEVNKAMQGMFILGIVYENKLQKKYGSEKLTEEDIALMEKYIDDISESLPPELRDILENRKVNLFMGLTTDIYM